MLDGTSQITPEITAAVAALKDNQILPLIATGRTLCEIQPIMKASGIDSAIVMNGQFIHYEGKRFIQMNLQQRNVFHCMNMSNSVVMNWLLAPYFLYRAYWHSETSL